MGALTAAAVLAAACTGLARPGNAAASTHGPPAAGPPITLSAAQLLINQRISQAAIRRVNALRAALDTRTTVEDAPPPIRVRVPRVSASASQLRINQRISQAAIRRLNAIRVEVEALRAGGAAPEGTPAAGAPPETSPTDPARGGRPRSEVTLSAGQLRVNQRISQAAIRRAEQIRVELEAALVAAAAPSCGAVVGQEPTLQRGLPFAEVPGRPSPLQLDLYRPSAAAGACPAVVLVHGGSWRKGDRAQLAPQARALARRGFVAVAIEYRLDSEHPFPDEIEDVRRAVAWLRGNGPGYGVDPKRVGLLGGSAGGNLAALVGSLGAGSVAEGTRVAAVASWSGPMDLREIATDTSPRPGCTPDALLVQGTCGLPELIVQAFAAQIMGCPLDENVPWVGRLSDLETLLTRADPCPELYELGSPILHVSPDDPPMLLAHATSDPLAPVGGSQRMAAALERAGVPVELLLIPGEAHAHGLDHAVFEQTVAFFVRHLGDPAE